MSLTKQIRKALVGVALLALATPSIAGTFTQTSPSGQPGGSVTTVVTFAGEGTTQDAQWDLTFNPAFFQVTAATALVNGSTCAFDNTAGLIRTVTPGLGLVLTSTATDYCSFTFSIGGAVPFASYPFIEVISSCTPPQDAPCATTTEGAIVVTSGPQPEVDAVPAPGARTISDQIGGGATNDVITISNVGAQGSTLTLSVAETADPSGVFTGVLSSGSVAQGANATLTVGCSATAAGPFTATYTVTTNDADEPTLEYTYTCDGTVGPAPEVNAVPAPGARIINDPVGGGATNDVITISNTGSAALTLSVAETGDTSSVFTGTLGSGSVAAGGSTTLTVGCTASGAGPFTATYTVTTNDSDEPTLTYTYTCNGVVAPEFDSTPAAGSTINLLGAPGAVLGGSVILRNTGTAPLAVGSCTSSGGFTVTSPTFPATIPAGGQSTVNFTCTAPAQAGGSFQGALSCTGITDADEPTASYTLTCSSQVLAVPAMSLAGKTLLATLLAGLGLLGFAMRRKFA